jgi:hypothetical protein
MKKAPGKRFQSLQACGVTATRPNIERPCPNFDQVISQEGDLGGLSGAIQATEGYQ